VEKRQVVSGKKMNASDLFTSLRLGAVEAPNRMEKAARK
jgi:hypothetical protein